MWRAIGCDGSASSRFYVFRSNSAERPKFASESARVSKALGSELASFLGFTALEHHEQDCEFRGRWFEDLVCRMR